MDYKHIILTNRCVWFRYIVFYFVYDFVRKMVETGCVVRAMMLGSAPGYLMNPPGTGFQVLY